MKTTCIFGDSIAWGALDAGGGWADCLKDFVMEEHDGIVYNLGVSGDDTNGVLKRFDIEASAREPDIAIFAVGINDSQRIAPQNENRVSLEQFRSNLKALVEKTREKGMRAVFVGLTRVIEEKTTPIPWKPDVSYTNADIASYDAAIREVAEEMSASYIDVSAVLSASDILDGVHPNAEGHRILFEVIKEKIRPVI